MKKTVCFLLVIFLLLTLTVYGEEVNGNGTVDATRLNVRAEASLDARIIGALYEYETVTVITKTGDWYKINFNGEIGFVHKDFLVVVRRGEARIQIEPQSEEGRELAQQVVDIAKEYIGTPYVWGGASPDGFDCSGFVYYVYKQMGVELNRVASEQNRNGIPVPLDQLEPGDLVFFWNKQFYSEINHVGIYIGNGEFIHSPQSGDVVKIMPIDSPYYQRNIYSARRIFE